MADARGFQVTAFPLGGEIFEIEANRVGTLIALLLRRQRERHGLTLNEAAERLGQRSRHYACQSRDHNDHVRHLISFDRDTAHGVVR